MGASGLPGSADGYGIKRGQHPGIRGKLLPYLFLAKLLSQRAQTIELPIGLGSGAGSETCACQNARAFDQDSPESQFFCRHMVVIKALGDVQNPIYRNIQSFDCLFKMRSARLVAVKLFGGNDFIKHDAQLARGTREEAVICVG